MSEFNEGLVNLEENKREEGQETFRNQIADHCLLTLGKLGINPQSLSQEEINILNEKINEVFEMYASESDEQTRLSDDQRWKLISSGRFLSSSDYTDHIINSWLISIGGVTIDEMAALQDYPEGEDGSVLNGIVGLRGSDCNAKEIFETPEIRKQLSSRPEIAKYRREMQEKAAQIITQGKSEQEIKEEMNRRLDRTGD